MYIILFCFQYQYIFISLYTLWGVFWNFRFPNPEPLSPSLYHFHSSHCCLIVHHRCQSIFMSVRELRSMRGGRKRLQSNGDEVTPKRSKTTNNDLDDGGNYEEQAEQPVKKAATQGKAKKGKKSRFVTIHIWTVIVMVYNYSVGWQQPSEQPMIMSKTLRVRQLV